MEQLRPSHGTCRNANTTATLENRQFPSKLNTHLPNTPLLRIIGDDHLGELKTCRYKTPCMQIYIRSITGAPAWLSPLSVCLLILAWVTISWLWDGAPRRAPRRVWSLLRILSLSPSLSLCPSPHLKINKHFFKRIIIHDSLQNEKAPSVHQQVNSIFIQWGQGEEIMQMAWGTISGPCTSTKTHELYSSSE